MSYKWKKGDFFALNNRLVMHSRNAYTGPRRVYAAMFGDAINTVETKRDGVGQVIRDYSALSVSDPTTFGMWRLDNPEETVYNAILAGYRRFDSACDYGNEEETGKGIRRAIAEGIVRREDLYITTKLWNTYHAKEHVPVALNKCLSDLGLDYVDEFLIHFPISMEVSDGSVDMSNKILLVSMSYKIRLSYSKYVPIDKKYPPEWTVSFL